MNTLEVSARYLYPNIDKEDVLKRFEMEERNRSPPPPDQSGYIGSEVIMVAKTGCAFPLVNSCYFN